MAHTDQDRPGDRPRAAPGSRTRGALPAAALCLAALAAGACTRGDPYPSLASVPPRPAPSSSSEDRRVLAQSLERDRALARYREEVVAYQAGARTTPPEPPPAAAAPSAGGEPVPPPEAQDRSAEAYVEDSLARIDDDGEIGDFMEQLARPIPGAEGSASLAAAVGLSPGAATGPTPGGGELVAQLAFAAGSLSVPDDAEPELRAALERARAGRGRLRIEADGRDESERLSRARAIVVELSRLGAADGQLRVLQGDAGDEARLFLEPAGTS